MFWISVHTSLKFILIICLRALKPHSPLSPASRSSTRWKDVRAARGSSSFKALLLQYWFSRSTSGSLLLSSEYSCKGTPAGKALLYTSSYNRNKAIIQLSMLLLLNFFLKFIRYPHTLKLKILVQVFIQCIIFSNSISQKNVLSLTNKLKYHIIVKSICGKMGLPPQNSNNSQNKATSCT